MSLALIHSNQFCGEHLAKDSPLSKLFAEEDRAFDAQCLAEVNSMIAEHENTSVDVLPPTKKAKIGAKAQVANKKRKGDLSFVANGIR